MNNILQFLPPLKFIFNILIKVLVKFNSNLTFWKDIIKCENKKDIIFFLFKIILIYFNKLIVYLLFCKLNIVPDGFSISSFIGLSHTFICNIYNFCCLNINFLRFSQKKGILDYYIPYFFSHDVKKII